jgi:ribonucleoside-diphosphate reductase beta chain
LSIFDKRVAFKPFEYPDIAGFKDAIHHSFWIVSEFNFTSDVHDFSVNLSEVERNAIKNTLLAISQIEVAVKKFWGKLGDRFPKAEFEMVGAVFADSEVRHADAYSHLLQVLNLNGDFEVLLENPVIKKRVDYLTKYLRGAADNSDENYMLTLTLFSLFIENISLFSQFVIIKSFFKYRNTLKNIDNVVQATQKEEVIHALLGVAIIRHIQAEFPDWFDDSFYDKVYRASRKAYEAECDIIDWIFEKGELPFLGKATLKEYIKHRFNASVGLIGGKDVFEVDQVEVDKLRWFEEEIHIPVNVDFFNKKPVTYSKKVQSYTEEDLF